jgi:hypothetical protein
MRALVFAPLAFLFFAVGLTVYYLSPPLGISVPTLLTETEAKQLYGPETPKGRELIGRANDVLAAIQGKCSQLRLLYVGPPRLLPASLGFSSYSYVREGASRTVVTFTTDDVKLEIIANNGMLVSYSNKALEMRLENGPSFEPPDQPKLSAQEAMELATNFLGVCPHDNDVRLSPPTANFDHTGETPTKTGMMTSQGEWWVRWQRIDEEGHVFDSDLATAVIAEGFGPSFLSARLDTPYHADTTPIISRDSAEKAARRAAADIRWSDLPFVTVNLEDSKLEICRPSKDLRNYEAGWENEGRLAWSQTFGCQLPGPSGGWIHTYVNTDAHTGKVINLDTGTGIGDREK